MARTAVSWLGDVETLWQEGLLPAQVALHQRTLALALASRDLLIRSLTMAAKGAVKLSVLMVVPGGAVLALPAAWKFVNQILDERSKYAENTKEAHHAK